jgi:hypothetical protein
MRPNKAEAVARSCRGDWSEEEGEQWGCLEQGVLWRTGLFLHQLLPPQIVPRGRLFATCPSELRV